MSRQDPFVSRPFPARPFPAVALLALLALIAGARPAAAQTVVNTQYGTGAQSGFGVVAPAGDIDHDGLPDLIVGAPLHDDAVAGSDAGRVLVLAGSDGHVLLTLPGTAAGQLFGSAVAGIGDVNGDGTADLLVGAPGLQQAVGRARVHSGSSGALLHVLQGGQPGDRFGASVAVTDDLDGDGVPDVLIGAPGSDGAGVPPLVDAGAAWIFSGGSGFLLHVFHGEHAGDMLGAAVGGKPADPLFADEEPTVLIGCTQEGVTGGAGLLRVHAGAAGNWALRFAAAGTAAGDRFGGSVSPVGDLDADGAGDVLVGGSGYARLLSGATGTLLALFSGSAVSQYGASVAGVGDVNGDGTADVAVGEPGADLAGLDAGAVHVYSGTTHAELHAVHGPQPHAAAGRSLAAAGDVNGDLLADVAVGAPGHGASGVDPGGVFTLSLTRWQDQGGGLPGVHDIPQLEGQGGLVANTEVQLVLTEARSAASVTLVLGTGVAIDAASGTLTPLPEVVTAGLLTGVEGTLTYSFTWPNGMPPGQTVYYQFRVADPEAQGGVALSNTLAGVVP
jgi:hypothetical protein